MTPDNLDQLITFHGELSPEQAYVYAQLDGDASVQSLRLTGHIVGPYNTLTRTLPAQVALRDLGPGPSKLASAIVPDPCFWAPGEPYLYALHVQLKNGPELLAETERTIGFRMSGVRDGELYLESRRWQIWGAADENVEATSWAAWRQNAMARLLVNPTDAMCQQASQEGVMLIAQLAPTTAAGVEQEVRRLGRHAAVVMMVLEPDGWGAERLRGLAPNVLFAQYCAADAPLVPAPWADLVVRRFENRPGPVPVSTDGRLPVLLWQSTEHSVSLAQARLDCQRLRDRLGTLEGLAGCLV